MHLARYVAVSLALCLVTNSAWASNQTKISNVVVLEADGAPTHLVITGENLTNGRFFKVFLSGIPLRCEDPASDLVTCDAPTGLIAGTYRLEVNAGLLPRKRDAMDVAVGRQGPKGERGPAGPEGSEGPAGPSGPQGERGATGQRGPEGPPGEAGQRGEPGPVGPQGVKGPPGLRGDLGPQGREGDVGPIGPAGPQGPQGPTGESCTVTPNSDGITARLACPDGSAALIQLASTPLPSGVLAIAFVNLDGFPGFSEDEDALISAVVDANGDGAVSVGDDVITNVYPSGFRDFRLVNFGVTRHPVTEVGPTLNTRRFVSVFSRHFNFTYNDAAVSNVERYEEYVCEVPISFITVLACQGDRALSISDNLDSDGVDEIFAASNAPSEPDVPFDTPLRGVASGDASFVDVEIF